MTTTEIGTELVAFCKKGQFMEAVNGLYADDIVSTEPFGENPVSNGLPQVIGKAEWWSSNFEVHGAEVNGPFVNGDQFVVEFKMDCTNKMSNERSVMHEMAVYTVRNGKIAAESFFYGG